MSQIEPLHSEYNEWLTTLKLQIRTAQQRAVLAVNHELVRLYWSIGADITKQIREQGWGSKIIHRLSADLKREFPDMKGFSVTNLKYMRMLAEAWTLEEISQAPLDQLTWYHLLTLQTKLNTSQERLQLPS